MRQPGGQLSTPCDPPSCQHASKCLPSEIPSAAHDAGVRYRAYPALWLASLAHLLNDGLAAALAPLLPFVAADLALSYRQAGTLKAALNGVMSLSQLPAGFLAVRFGEAVFLGIGLSWFSLGFLCMGMAGSYLTVLLLMALAGMGGGAYHPVGTAWISRIFLARRRGTAVGTLNFFGDVGKVALPALAGALIPWIGWRGSLTILGLAGIIVASILIWWGWTRSQADTTAVVEMRKPRGWGIAKPGQFAVISLIGLMDQSGRSGAIAFLGFLLRDQGLPESALGWLVATVFAGGAFGKFGCGLLTGRFEDRQVIAMTETAVAMGCLLLAFTEPGSLLIPLLLCFGFALNGTSSVIYTRLADTLRSGSFSRGYALYYTLSFASSALSPILYGWLADQRGLSWIYALMAVVALCILPVLSLLRGAEGSTVGHSP